MASRFELRADRADQVADARSSIEEPATPLDVDAIPASQVTLPSTEGPASPLDPNMSFKTELNDDRITSSIIPSSLTPPPSSQLPGNGVPSNVMGYTNSQRTAILSPPVTGLYLPPRREEPISSDYSPPSPTNVVEASADELRAMLQNCIAEHHKLKMETAHHKLQHNLLSMQAEEDAKRAAVEREMTLREVEALRAGEHMRQARRELSTISESAHAKYNELRRHYDRVVDDNTFLQQKVKNAKKLIQDLEDEVLSLRDEKDVLLTRLRENREHFHQLCSPGGIFHSVMTPKTQTATSPPQYRATPRQTPRSGGRGHRERDHDDRIDDLLQAANLSQENNSAPSTPIPLYRQLRHPPKHTRNVQSMSSLPTTPVNRHRGGHAGLLPSADLVPQTEPPRRYHNYSHSHYIPETPTHDHDDDRKDRESTISAEEDNEELARQALQSFASRVSRGSASHSQRHHHDEDEEEEIYESQATQAASDMLRRDPRESFEVASSRGGTPGAVGEKSAKLQAKLLGSLGKGAVGEKRKYADAEVDERIEAPSPSKRRRGASLVGLGIQ